MPTVPVVPVAAAVGVVSGSARSPLSVADAVFTALQRGPDPLAIHPSELTGPSTALSDGTDLPLVVGRRPIPLARLAELLRRADATVEFKNRAWSALVTRAQQHGGAWTVGAVGVALGPLVCLTTELANGGRLSRPDLDAEVLAGFLAALATVNPAAKAVFPHLMRQARRAGLGWLRHQRAADTPIGHTWFDSSPPARPWGHPDLVLADAVAAGVITAYEAALIGATRLDRLPLRTIAGRDNTELEALYKRRRRAEHRLAVYLAGRITHAGRAAALHPTAAAASARLAARPDTSAARQFLTVERDERRRCPELANTPPSYRRGGTAPAAARAQSTADTRPGIVAAGGQR